MSLLSRLLEKRNIKSEEELFPEEKALYDTYKRLLTGDVVTVESIKQFCKTQIQIAQTKFAGPPSKDDTYLKACLHVYLNILKAIEAPEAERESLERYLTQLIEGE